MMVLLLLNNCATELHDGPGCIPFPVEAGQCRGSQGGACDNFLTANQQILDAPGLEKELEGWEGQGCGVEEISSCFWAEIKAELEKACSQITCTEEQQANIKKAIDTVQRHMDLAKKAVQGRKAFFDLL